MDLQLYIRVLGRFKVLVGAGAVLALLLAFVSMVKVDPLGSKKFSYRQSEQWVSYTKLFVTEPGFPWGSLSGADATDPGRLTSLAILYSQLANSDAVKAIMRQRGPVNGSIEIATIPAGPNSSEDLPLISIAAFSDSAAGAKTLAKRQADAFRQYLIAQQTQNRISANERVQVNVVQQARYAQLVKGRSKTLPIVIFLTVMVAVIGLAFLLENLRPRIRAVTGRQNAALEAGKTGNVA